MKRRSFLALLSATTANALASTSTFANLAHRGLQTNVSRLAPPDGQAAAGTVRFVALGDMGTGDNNQFAIAGKLAAYYNESLYDTVLMLGDNIYPDGDPSNFQSKFERPYDALLKRGVKFHAVLGNHDVRRGREAQVNYKPFNMNGRAFYSFTKGDGLVEFFALDSNDFDQAQERWLEGALAASQARWKLAYFHHPIYSSARAHGSNTRLRAKLEPLFARYGVTAAFSGHDHTYERTRLQQGVQYFVSGVGGQLRRGDLDRRSPLLLAGNDEVRSFMSVEITRDQLSFRAIDAAGRILDSGTLAPREAVRTKAATH
jgi:predicted MPP superfamily phosphohydrolase